MLHQSQVKHRSHQVLSIIQMGLYTIVSDQKRTESSLKSQRISAQETETTAMFYNVLCNGPSTAETNLMHRIDLFEKLTDEAWAGEDEIVSVSFRLF